MTRAVRLAGLGLVAAMAACSSAQDPGIPASDPHTTQTTSSVLQPCPPGGPDATTPPAGCVAENGAVLRP